MLFQRRSFIFYVAVWLLTTWASGARADGFAMLTDMGVDNRDGSASIGFNISFDDEAPLLDALQSGGEFEVSCEAELYRHRPALWNVSMGKAVYSCRVAGNPMARECVVRDERGRHTFAFDTVRDDLNHFWTGLSLPLAPWERIERNNLYLVRMTFKILRTNMSQWVSTPLFFVNWDLVPETVYEVTFEY